jgi:hypothetical protein
VSRFFPEIAGNRVDAATLVEVADRVPGKKAWPALNCALARP